MAHAGGRPLKYTANEVADIIDRFLRGCVEEKKLPSKAGLCLALDISRETYREYKERDEFGDTIKRAEFVIEDAWIQRLSKPQATGAIFYLKNAFKENYRDQYETDITTGGKPLPTPIMNVPTDHSDKEDSAA